MATNKFIPNYTNRSEDRRTREVITNTDWNELWNLNSAQGDHSEKYLLDFTKYLIGSNGFDDTIANKVGTLDSDKEDKSTANLLCASIEYNSTTGVMIFKNRNSAEMARIDLNIEKIPVRVEVKWLDNSTTPPIVPPEVPGWYLRIINTDDTDTRCIVSNLFNPITFTEDAQHIVHFDVTTASDGTKTVKATVSQGTITADHLSSELKSSIEAAKDYSEISEAYAKGTVNGVKVAKGEIGYNDNASYYKDLAEDAQEAAETAQGLAESAQESAESAKTAAESARDKIINMTVGATTLSAGQDATVTKSEQGGVVHLQYGIPKGPKGDQGDPGLPGGVVSLNGKTGVITGVLEVPNSAPVSQQLVSVDTSNTQSMLNVGTGLEINNGQLNCTATGNVTDVQVGGTSIVDAITGIANIQSMAYTTVEPTSAHTGAGLKLAVLDSAPSSYYQGWLYYIKE